MKVIKMFESDVAIDNNYRSQIEKGRFYHCNRLSNYSYNGKTVLLSMNIFERSLASFLDLFNFNFINYWISKNVKREVVVSVPAVAKHQDERQAVSTELSHPSGGSFTPFEQYMQERNARNEPVDLIVGRGRLADSSYPKLCTQRGIGDQGGKANYKPFAIDCDQSQKPDAVASFDDIEQMRFIPDSSLDEIYLERLYPPRVLLNLYIYINAARILKVGGVLFGEYNDGMKPEAIRQQKIDKWFNFFARCGIPLVPVPFGNLDRSSLTGFQKFAWQKCAEFDADILNPRNLKKRQLEWEKS